MSEIIAGTVSGVFMAMVFVGVGSVIVFVLLKNPPQLLKHLSEQGSVVVFAIPLAFLSQAIWAIVGVVLGLLYRISLGQAPGPGIGSPNLAYTLGVIIVAVVMAPPIFILMRRVWQGLTLLFLSFVGIFGWFLPYFAG